jgi:hypothetical protein
MIHKNSFTVISRLSKRGILILLVIFTSLSVTLAQKKREEPPPFRERLFFGGNFGLQFGSITDIQISPVVGLWVLPRIAVALGPDYRFYKDSFDRTNIYGGKGYIQFVVFQDLNSFLPLGIHTGLFLHLEDEWLNLETSFWKYPPYVSDRFNINTALAGVGISQQLGRRSSLNIMALWALNDSGYEIYGNPDIRISFNF